MLLQILHFPYPTPPDSDALRSAEKSLVAISALTPKNALLSQQTSTGADLKLTAVGEEMVGYPLPPRHSRLILAAAELLQQGRFKDKKLLVYAIGLAAAMSMETPFLASASSPTGPQTHSASDASEKVLTLYLGKKRILLCSLQHSQACCFNCVGRHSVMSRQPGIFTHVCSVLYLL